MSERRRTRANPRIDRKLNSRCGVIERRSDIEKFLFHWRWRESTTAHFCFWSLLWFSINWFLCVAAVAWILFRVKVWGVAHTYTKWQISISLHLFSIIQVETDRSNGEELVSSEWIWWTCIPILVADNSSTHRLQFCWARYWTKMITFA